MSLLLAVKDLSPTFFRMKAQVREKRLRFTKPGVCLPSPSTRGHQRLLSSQGNEDDHASPAPPLPPRWVDTLEELHDDVAHIKEKMGQLQKVQQRRLLQVFGGLGECNLGAEVDAQTAVLTQLFRRCESKVQQLQTSSSSSRGRRGSSSSTSSAAASLLQQNARKSIAVQLQGLSRTFRQQQKAYLDEVRRRCHGDDLLPESTAPSLSQQRGYSDEFGGELDVMEAETDRRREEVSRIAQSVVELHQMFRDTATLVVEQGTILDRIDYNVEQVAHQTAQATREVRKAEESRRGGRAKKCILGLSGTILLLLVLIILKHTHR